MTTSMDDILSNAPAPSPAQNDPPKEDAKPDVAVEVKAEPAEPSPEPASEVKEEKKEPEPAKEPELSVKEKAFLAKANDEKNKRQELERRIAEMEAKQAAQPKEPEKELWEDPEAYENRIKAITQEQYNKMEQLVTNTRLNTAEQIARSKYSDFDDKVEVFKEVLNKSPWVYEEMKRAADPAEFVYNTAKNYQELQQAGNMEEYRAKVERDVRAKLEAEYRTKEEAKKKELENIPDTLSNARSTGTNKPVWSGPTPLDDVLH